MSDLQATRQRELADWLRTLAEFQRRFAESDAKTREVLQSSAVALERLRAAKERRGRRRRWFC